MKITESRVNDILHWLDDETGNHALLFEKMTLHRDAAALIRQLQAELQDAWHAGLDAGREQGRGKDHAHPSPSAPVGVETSQLADELEAWAKEPFVDLTPMRRMDIEGFARRIRVLAQQPAACAHSWHDYGTVNRAWCSRCNAVAVTGHEDRPYGVLSVTDDGEYRTDSIQQPAAVSVGVRGLPRYGFPDGNEPRPVPCTDGYWTPWHLAQALRNEAHATAAKDAEIEELRADLADYMRIANTEATRAERLAEALRDARDYVTTALREEREKFAGHEDCSDIPGIEADLHKIDSALNPTAAREKDDA
jgi:hypothetical protein